MSPSLWYAGQDMLRRLSEADPKSEKPGKVWLDMGTKEANPDWSLESVAEFQQAGEALEKLGYTPEKNFFPRLVEGGEHTNEAWRNRSEEFLMTMFGKGGENA